MTIEEYFETVILPVLGENPDQADAYEEDNIAGVCNAVFSECLDINNKLLKKVGLEELEPNWYEIQDEIPFDKRLLMECCCYGIAWKLIIDDSDTDMGKIDLLRQEYEKAKEKFSKTYMGNVVRWWQNG